MKVIAVLIIALIVFVGAMQPGTAEFFTEPAAHAESAEKLSTNPSPVLKPATEPLTTSLPTPSTSANLPRTSTTNVTAPLDNETIIWNYLTAQGFSREQTAGIMGNLQQEHHFQTSGDGLAQWIGNRKANLMARPNPYDINTQLDFLMEELNGPYIAVKQKIFASSLTDATLAFQNGFERCGLCMESNRLQYASDILGRH